MNKLSYYLSLSTILIFLTFIGCSPKIAEEDLVGGYWIGTAGYKDGKPEGTPYCFPFEEGIEFKDNETVHIEAYDKDYKYWLESDKVGTIINFRGGHDYLSYYIDKINDDALGLVGEGDFQEGESCYLERQ
ncbi:MAG TPA: hypothetical protein VK072_01080 [Candidatus Avamphibacillus sp.]|nr:hypothetical protein [Candidatus Avamphibacillus sp.]